MDARRRQKADELIRVIDIGDGLALTVVGAAPAVGKVLGTHWATDQLFRFKTVMAEALTYYGSVPWPDDIFTPAQRIYGAAWIVPMAQFDNLDLLQVYVGASKYGTAEERYYLWQREAKEVLTRLSLIEARKALASPWFSRARDGSTLHRGIILR
jgi:hypothetical protein